MHIGKKKIPLVADGRIWISTAEGKLMGKGRIELMEKIKQFGSIRQAALAMQMSYRQPWQLIDDMNSKAKTSLVVSSRGGKGGGNAVVTPEGEQLIKLFNDFNKKFQKLLEQHTQKFIL